MALRCLASGNGLKGVDAAALLGERAAILELSRGGRTSPGGSCRLLATGDGWFAVNLARADDVRLLPAWLGEGEYADPWRFVAERAVDRSSAELVERGRLLGLAVATLEHPPQDSPHWLRVVRSGRSRSGSGAAPLVVDLSSLWAGPLCTHLLAKTGARGPSVHALRGIARRSMLLSAPMPPRSPVPPRYGRLRPCLVEQHRGAGPAAAS